MHTNVLKGGRTDACLEYFNMKDYFKFEGITQFYVINRENISSYLKKDLLKEIYKIKIEEANKKVDITEKLLEIWD